MRRQVTGRDIHLVLENDRNEARRLTRRNGRPQHYDAQWDDDLHHALHALMTGETTGYYSDYAADPAASLGRALAEGFAYQGEKSVFRGGTARGEPSAGLPPTAFVAFLQNHDQVGNHPFGARLASRMVEPALHAGAAIVLLSPQIPLLFMGEEWASRQPFAFFCDFEPGLAQSVREGRRREFAHSPEFGDEAARERIPDPTVEATFTMSRLDWAEPEQEDARAVARPLSVADRSSRARNRAAAGRHAALRRPLPGIGAQSGNGRMASRRRFAAAAGGEFFRACNSASRRSERRAIAVFVGRAGRAGQRQLLFDRTGRGLT